MNPPDAQPGVGVPRWKRVVALLHAEKGAWRGYALIWALTIVNSAVLLLQPWPMKILVDHVFGEAPPPAWLTPALSALGGSGATGMFILLIAAATLLIFTLQMSADVALTMAWLRIAQRGVYRLAGDLYAHLQRRTPVFHAVTPIGESLRRITGDSWCIYNALGALIFTPLHALLVGSAMTIMLLAMNSRLALIALAAAPVLAVLSIRLGRHAERTKGIERQIQGQIESHLQQSLAGIRVVQTSAQEDREHRRFLLLAGSAVLAHRRSALVAALAGGSAGLMTAIGTGLVLGLGALEVLAGRLTLGQLLVFIAYLGILNGQLVRLATAYTTMRGLGPSIDRVAEVLDAPPEVADAPAPDSSTSGAIRHPGTSRAAGLSIALEGVWFEYRPGSPALRDVSLQIPAGRTVAIVGPSGSGKSTLASLLVRLMDPTRGRIVLDGHDLRTIPLDRLRSLIAVAFQEPMLLGDTIARNIALGCPDATPQQVRDAGSAAGLDPFIARLPAGYDTQLGESGATVSGGEQQRISIARALITDAPILVLDEPTSALDAATEAKLLQTLQPGASEARAQDARTTIIIAHRLSTIRRADLIAVIEAGRIVERGTHEELIERAGLYARMWAAQEGPSAPAFQMVAEKEPVA